VAPLAQLFRLLQLAEAHDVMLVENDIYADLDPQSRPSLASLDQLKRVVHVGSYSKTVSPNLRVGYVVASPQVLDELAQLKMVSGLTSSDLTERIVFGALTEGRWRKHLKSLRDRLAEAHGRVAHRLIELGFELFHEPKAGMYLWARHPDLPDSAELSRQAVPESIMLGPGQLFLVEPRPTGWLRFNVAFSDDERLYAFLSRQIALQAQSAAA
jgi:DNA-binding transcriptional MocR family regulator